MSVVMLADGAGFYLSATVGSDGSLRFDGQRLGDDFEYEYVITVGAGDVDRVRAALGCGEDLAVSLREHASEILAVGVKQWL